MQNSFFDVAGYLLVTIGAVLVIASGYRLGFFCCFMGDYFGILLEEKVTGFPFNIVADPMYVGSVLVHIGLSLQYASIVGLILTACIASSYAIAALLERPFTDRIYENRKKED